VDVTSSHKIASVKIRSATAEDYPHILAVWNASGLGISAEGRDGLEAFGRQLEQFRDLYLVATDTDRIIGVVLGTHDLRKGWINRLAVLPEYRRMGLASRLVQACDVAVRRLGIEIVTVLIEPTNTASAALFEKLDYREDVPVCYLRKLTRPGA